MYRDTFSVRIEPRLERAMHRLAMYSPVKGREKGDLPISPFVHIEVGTHSRDDGHILLSAQLMSDAEIDEAVQQLKSELDEFSKAAKRELRQLRDKMIDK